MIKRIGNNIVLLKLSDSDSNIYLIDNVAIDSGTGFNFTRLYVLLKALKKTMEDIQQVINTHGHFDHVGGNGYFLNAKIAIHEKDADIIETGDTERSVADFFDGKLKPRTVDRKLKDGDILNVGDMELEVIHTPGHTPGSICLYNRKDGILFTGDTIFADGVGRTDLPGGDTEALKESIEKLKKLDVKVILPGHGELVLENAKNVIENAAEMTDYM
jgi:glyoxylase-like metal-dependent hydrolase (beta-lactamase superfamily II)